jgi:transketolase N-terminal domain/subunit
VELGGDERQELVRLRATVERLETQLAVQKEATTFYKAMVGSFGQAMCSAAGLALDLPDQGQKDRPEVLVDLAAAEQSGFQRAGG